MCNGPDAYLWKGGSMKNHDIAGRCFKTILVCSIFLFISISGLGEFLFNTNAFSQTIWQNTGVVTTKPGDVQGFEDDYDTWAWKAIPYTQPPVGDLRWQAPQDPLPWTGIRQETEFCSKCPQFTSAINPGPSDSIIQGNEDCLYLNIWRPQSEEKELPVYFWIHGGSNIQGSADPYIGATIASRSNMVVVTINYRLGPLGWFTHSALREFQDDISSAGNYGTLDIIKALEWVRDNIEAFGGNPQNVTIAGQSAGGVNDLSLMISPLAKGLFHRVISQSGGLQPASFDDGDEYANAVIEALLVIDGTPQDMAAGVRASMNNTEIRDYLMSKTAVQLFTAIQGMKTNPNVFNDGTVLREEGENAFDDPAKYNQVPVIIGSTSEEGKLFMYLAGLDEQWGPRLYQAFGKQASRIARKISLDKIAGKIGAHESQPGVYCYIFQYGQYRRVGYNAWPTDEGPTENMSWAIALGAFHAIDIPFNFGMIGTFPLFGGLSDVLFREDNKAGAEALSDAMLAYTAQFCRTGKPDPEGLPEWTEWPGRRGGFEKKFLLFDANDTEALIEMSSDVK